MQLLEASAIALASSTASVLLFGRVLANVPIARLGTNHGAGYNTRVLGYDSSRGEFSTLATSCIFGPWLLVLPCLGLEAACAALVGLALCGRQLRGVTRETLLLVRLGLERERAVLAISDLERRE